MKTINLDDKYYYAFVALFGLTLIFVFIPLWVQEGEPRIFPYIYSTMITLTAIFKISRRLLFKTKQRKNDQDLLILKHVGITMLACFLYSYLIQYLGFFSMSILFIFIFTLYLGESLKIAITLSVLLPAVIYILFTKILLLYFPTGILF